MPSTLPPDRSSSTPDPLGDLGRIPLWSTPLREVLQQVALLARAAVPAADDVSVTLVDGSGPATAASTGRLAADLDAEQYAHGAGPCLDAARDGTVVSLPDVGTGSGAERYPAFTGAARRAGVRAVLSVGAPARERVSGGLNLYSTTGAFDAGSADAVAPFARYAVAVADAGPDGSAQALTEQMRAATATRAVIEQAKGVVMFRSGCGPEEAFALLTRQSQGANRKIRDIAAELVRSTQGPSPR